MPIRNRSHRCNKRDCTTTASIVVTLQGRLSPVPVDYRYCQEHYDLAQRLISKFEADNRRRGFPKHWNITHEKLA